MREQLSGAKSPARLNHSIYKNGCVLEVLKALENSKVLYC